MWAGRPTSIEAGRSTSIEAGRSTSIEAGRSTSIEAGRSTSIEAGRAGCGLQWQVESRWCSGGVAEQLCGPSSASHRHEHAFTLRPNRWSGGSWL